MDKANTASTVRADTAYRSRRNEAWLIRNGLFSKVHHRRLPGKPLPDKLATTNAARSRVRSRIEHVFTHRKARMGPFVRTIGIAGTGLKIGMANLVYNMQRLVWFESRTSHA